MDIEKILSLLEDCLKLLKCPLAGEQIKISYAFEFILILIGETIHTIIEDIEKFVFSDELLFLKLLKDSGTTFNERKIKDDKAYRVQTFRAAFNKCNIGKNLSLLNFLRNEIKHNFIYLTDEDHKKIRMLYFKVQPISAFINHFNALVKEYKSNSAALINTIFSNQEIIAINFDEVKEVEKLFKDGKKIITNTKTFEEQQQAIINRIQMILELMNKVDLYSKKLDEVRQFKGHEADLYAPLMCITGIGVNCIKLIEYRKKENTFQQELRRILKANNNLFAPFSYLATRYTHQIHVLPKPKQTVDTCTSILKEKANFQSLVSAITSVKNPSKKVEAASEEEKETHKSKHQKTKNEKIKEEKEAKIPSSGKSIISSLHTFGSPVHSHHPKKEKHSRRHDEEEEILEQAKKKKADKDALTKQDEDKKKQREQEVPRKKST